MSEYFPDEVLLSTKTDYPTKIFISYAHAQDEIVAKIYEGLKKRGHDVWIDESEIKYGDDWREKIANGIESSNGVLSFLSKEAVRENGVCLDELAIAISVKYGNIHTVLLQKEEDVKPPAQLTHRQWLDMSEWKDKLAQGDAVFMLWFQPMLADIIRKIESPESREFVGMISTIREKLRIGDLAVSRQNWYLKQKYVGRAWLTQDIEAWMNTPRSGKLCAVYGGPGVGKSAFAAQYAYRSPRVAASIFFEHGNAYFNTSGSLIRELIFQLACRLPLYRNRVYGIVTTNDQLKAWNDQELFTHLIKAPLTEFQIDGGHETLCIVVDGLDECTVDEQNGVAKLLGKYVQEFPEWLRVLVLSRRESDVTGWLNPDHQIDMVGGEARNLSDIRLYFSEILKEQLKQQLNRECLLDELTKRTKGVFLYAYVVSQMILDGKLALENTDAYPQGLNNAFKEWFSRYFPDVLEYKRLYRLYLGMIAVSPEPIPLEELDVVNVRFDAAEDCYQLNTDSSMCSKSGSRQDRLKQINSLLQYQMNEFGKRTVTFNHKYIAEWLTQADEETNESPAGCYYCNPKDAFWAMECTWRKNLAAKLPLTEYETLYLLTYVERTESNTCCIECAKESALSKYLRAYRLMMEKRLRYSKARRFAVTDEYRCYIIWRYEPTSTNEIEYLNKQEVVARIMEDNGSYAEALEKQLHIANSLQKLMGGKHPDVLISQNNLCSLYSKVGRIQEAVALQKKVCKASKQALGKYDSTTLKYLHNLSCLYGETAQYEKSMKITKAVYNARKAVLGGKHPDTISSMHSLSIEYFRLGQIEKALQLAEAVVDCQSPTVTPHIRKSFIYFNTLAHMYCQLGRLEDALEFRYAVDAIKVLLGAEHPESLSAMETLVSIYQTLDRNNEALDIELQVYNGRKRQLGEYHKDTVRSMNILAVLYTDLGQHSDALRIYKQMLEIKKRTRGDEHSETVSVMEQIALIYSRLELYEQALPVEESILLIRSKTLPKDNDYVLSAMHNLLMTYINLNRHVDALPLARKVYATKKQCLGARHSETLEATTTLSGIYYELGHYDECLPLDKQLLRVAIAKRGEVSSESARLMNNLAMDYSKVNRYDKAFPLMQKVYEIRCKLLGEHHELTEKAKDRAEEFQKHFHVKL